MRWHVRRIVYPLPEPRFCDHGRRERLRELRGYIYPQLPDAQRPANLCRQCDKSLCWLYRVTMGHHSDIISCRDPQDWRSFRWVPLQYKSVHFTRLGCLQCLCLVLAIGRKQRRRRERRRTVCSVDKYLGGDHQRRAQLFLGPDSAASVVERAERVELSASR